jgi:SAM-dependent methyltransferase
MGRWSRLVGEKFIDWLAAPTGLKWIDVGCGSGALSAAIAKTQNPRELVAIDQSEGFVQSTRQRLGSRAECVIGDALDIPSPDSRFDLAVSGLVLNFVPEPEKMLREMRRVAIPDGVVAVYIWDYAGRMEFLTYFWDSVLDLDPDAIDLHEARRFPDANAEGLARQFVESGLTDVIVEPIEVTTRFESFDDYWQPFLGGQGPAGTYVFNLENTDKEKLRTHLSDRLPIQADGSVQMTSRAWCAKCET